MIPDEIITQVQDRLNIVEVVSQYVQLKKAGQNFKACCPFHSEKTPSFMVNPAKQIFHCFGCGEGGDAISFVMKFERLEFPEALRMLATGVGVEVPTVTSADPTRVSETGRLVKALEFAAGFYQQNLQRPSSEAVRKYLHDRGLNDETIQSLKIGVAPDEWDGLLNAARAAGIEPETLEKAGLAVAREGKTGFYDRFRGRVVFPVQDARGKLVGFGGRAMGDAEPKYLNSPETPVYAKSRILYGLHLGASQVRERDEVAVVEGYFDFAIPFQHGIGNVVASMGTALTTEQIHLIRRYTKRVVMVYDSDGAGELATLRGLDLLLQEGMHVRVAELPEGHDPDSFVREAGADALKERLASAKDLFDYKLSLLSRRFDPKTADGKVSICEQMLPTIKRVTNAVERSEYLKALAQKLNVQEEALRIEASKLKSDEPVRWKPKEVVEKPQGNHLAERMLLGLVLEDPRFLVRLSASKAMERICDEQVKEILDELRRVADQDSDQSMAVTIKKLKSGARAACVAEAMTLSETVSEKQRALEDCLHGIDKLHMEQRKAQLQDQIRTAESSGENEKAAVLTGEFNQLMRSQV